MTAPKRIWVNVYPDGDPMSASLYSYRTEGAADDAAYPRAITHEYRLVKPKRDPADILYWVLKFPKGGYWRDSGDVNDRRMAYRYASRERAADVAAEECASAVPVPVYRKERP